MTASRKLVREELAKAIAADMVDAHSIYDHKPAALDEDGSPAVMVLSAGTTRDKLVTAGFSAGFYFEIHNLVLYADPDTERTEEDAEDDLDTLEYQLAVFMDDPANLKGDYWKSIRYVGRSAIGNAVIGGTLYQDEIIPLLVMVP